MSKPRPPAFPYGALQGRIELPADVLAAAAALSAELFAQWEKDEFAGDDVEDIAFPDWMADRRMWIPPGLASLGFETRARHVVGGGNDDDRREEQLLATPYADDHIDNAWGPTLAIILFNDGLTFRQGRHRHQTQAGEWFVFDDRMTHSAKETKKSTVYMLWSVALQPIR